MFLVISLYLNWLRGINLGVGLIKAIELCKNDPSHHFASTGKQINRARRLPWVFMSGELRDRGLEQQKYLGTVERTYRAFGDRKPPIIKKFE